MSEICCEADDKNRGLGRIIGFGEESGIDGDSVVGRGDNRGIGDVRRLPRTIVVWIEFFSSLSVFRIRGRGNSTGNSS